MFNYGAFDVEELDVDFDGFEVKRVRGMSEKPAPEEAPSTLVATGRYLLDCRTGCRVGSASAWPSGGRCLPGRR